MIPLLASPLFLGSEPTAYSTRLVRPSPSVSTIIFKPSYGLVTVTTKLLVVLMVVEPVELTSMVVTTVVMTLVLGLWFSVGVQVMMPLVSMVTPAGGLIN